MHMNTSHSVEKLCPFDTVSHTYMQDLFWVQNMALRAVGETIKPRGTAFSIFFCVTGEIAVCIHAFGTYD